MKGWNEQLGLSLLHRGAALGSPIVRQRLAKSITHLSLNFRRPRRLRVKKVNAMSETTVSANLNANYKESVFKAPRSGHRVKGAESAAD